MMNCAQSTKGFDPSYTNRVMAQVSDSLSNPASPIESELIDMAQNISSVLRRIDDIEQTISSILRQDPPVDNMAKALEAAPACEMQTRLRNLNRDLSLAISRLGAINARVQL